MNVKDYEEMLLKVEALSDSILEGLDEGLIREADVNELYQLTLEEETLKIKAKECLSIGIGKGILADIWLYSYLLSIKVDKDMFRKFVERVFYYNGEELHWNNLYYVNCQFGSLMFGNPVLSNQKIAAMLWGILRKAFQGCKDNLGIPLERIPKEERNYGYAVVLTGQFLSEVHGPTKTALDRCAVLQKIKAKNVLLINTAELLPHVGRVPFFQPVYANYIEEYIDYSEVEWKGMKFSYYQCEDNMPNIDEIQNLVAAVQRLKPSIIVEIGGSSMVAGILNELVPVVTVGTTQSGLASTLADFQIADKVMLQKSYPVLEAMNLPESHVIEGLFTFALKTQIEHVTRQQLGLDDNKFAIAIVGARLDNEITDDFLDMLETCVDDTMQVGVVGMCDSFEDKIRRHPVLKDKMINLGFCQDILSRIEHFDLYVNPTRKGGGTSAVEAFAKGVPVVTVDYGDVAGIVGEAFCCKDYGEMKQIIVRYKEDKAFYESQSQKARELADVYLDSDSEFSRVVDEYFKRCK